MKFALNYSRPAADLLRRGEIAIDYFKCPNWPEIVDEAAALAPAFIHIPFETEVEAENAGERVQGSIAYGPARI